MIFSRSESKILADRINHLPLAEAALVVTQVIGWPIAPAYGYDQVLKRCACGQDRCPDACKHFITEDGHLDASIDPEQIKQWWQQYPNANISMPTGDLHPDRAIVIDADNVEMAAPEMLPKLFSGTLLREDLSVVKTGRQNPSGGHFYFRNMNHILESQTELIVSVDLLADDAWVIMPPSQHITGKLYQWSQLALPLALAPHGIYEKSDAYQRQRYKRLVRYAKRYPILDDENYIREVLKPVRIKSLSQDGSQVYIFTCPRNPKHKASFYMTRLPENLWLEKCWACDYAAKQRIKPKEDLNTWLHQ